MDDIDASTTPVPPAPGDWRTFSLTEADLAEGMRIQLATNLGTRRSLWSIAVFAAMLLAYGYTSNGMWGLGAWALGIVVFVIAFPAIFVPLQVRSALRGRATLKEPWRIAVAPDGLHLRNADGDTRYRWGGFVARRVGRNVLLLNTTSTTSVPIPLRALEPRDREAIDVHLRAAGVALDGSRR